MITEQEIDQTIEEIEEEWRANGYFGDVRDDRGLIYEVVTRLCCTQLEGFVSVPKRPSRKMLDRMAEVEEDGYEAMWVAAIAASQKD